MTFSLCGNITPNCDAVLRRTRGFGSLSKRSNSVSTERSFLGSSISNSSANAIDATSRQNPNANHLVTACHATGAFHKGAEFHSEVEKSANHNVPRLPTFLRFAPLLSTFARR